MASIKVNSSAFDKGMQSIQGRMNQASLKGLTSMALEIMRLSSYEVPHDTGLLQASGGVVSMVGNFDSVFAGYNKVYAARLHEHPEYHFQKGRKGKYLEDPIKMNYDVLRDFYAESIRGAFV